VLELLGRPSLLIGSKSFWTFIKCPKNNYTKLYKTPIS
jgi:hypothetical protein